ncbi:MAG: hypothetical protein EXS63_02920 [Candidatus Omnitrophica bacterium]|nr:hypothetical protein [Candidatus Omnitrophota bacterium]
MDVKKALGFYFDAGEMLAAKAELVHYVHVKLASMGYSMPFNHEDSQFIHIADSLLRNYQEKSRLLSDYLCPADYRIQYFLDDYLKEVPLKFRPRLPSHTFILDQHGLARILSLPHDRDFFESDYVSSYRLFQGVLNNPKSDRRTTQGVFHIVEGGLAIPDDKQSVSKSVFGMLLYHALNPPKPLMMLPYTTDEKRQPFETFVSLLLRPLVCPEVKGFIEEKTMEIRFFAPGSLVSNLDFVESIFGNAGDPYLPENDAGLDAEHWTGHSGCVILAPHLTKLNKKELGLPHWNDASERQQRDGMCWKSENEFYNDGIPFKITCRDQRGIMVTLIADNYFGYCKKEVKTQISMSANLFGLCEEEHSGGAVAFRRYDQGEKFSLAQLNTQDAHTFEDVKRFFGDLMELHPEGYGIDKNYPEIIYLPENALIDLGLQTVSWTWKGGLSHSIKLLPTQTYIYPSGYKVNMEKKFGGRYWRLIGTVGEGTMCHKPSTVSGGGKSEISKPIANSIVTGPVFCADFEKDLNYVDEILKKDYGHRFKSPHKEKRASRPILSQERSLGSVIKLLTPLPEYTEEYNSWLKSIPNYIKELVFIVKRFYKQHWGNDWREHFGVDIINGAPGYELKYHGTGLVANYLRVGMEKDGAWRLYQLRQDFNSAEKLQVEDDITASVVVPRQFLSYLNPHYVRPSLKIVQNCEYRLFQRPDEAIHRGYDKETEIDFTRKNNFLSNYEPLTKEQAKAIIYDAVQFDRYTDKMKKFIRQYADRGDTDYFVTTSHPRIVNGIPTKNPRYLQNRPDLVDPRKTHLAYLGARLYRQVPLDQPVVFAVNAVLSGRRCNPPEPESGIHAMAVYNPIHYQELPELFMDYICSLTGKSPSTTGAGSEGALTKGPFNALLPTADLNNALVSMVLTGYDGFSTAAGYVGPDVRVDHDISLLIPEIWCRMMVEERDPKFLILEGYLEKMDDFEEKGRKILASRLGYRITKKFVNSFLGRVFNNPSVVFSDDILKPELQDRDIFVDGIVNIMEAQQRVALSYFRDGSIEMACPPLRILLHIMAHGHYEGKGLNDPGIRSMFTRDYLLRSEWYAERLKIKQASDIQLWRRHIHYLEQFLSKPSHVAEAERLGIPERVRLAREHQAEVESPRYLEKIKGTLGSDPVYQERLKVSDVSRGAKLSV